MNKMNNMRDYDRSPDTIKIWELHLSGHSAPRIQRELGFKSGKVTSAIRRGRESGIIPRPVVKNPFKFGVSTYARLGSVSSIIEGLDQDQLSWLASEVKRCECETVAEMLLEYVRDAYEEHLLKTLRESKSKLWGWTAG